MSNVHTFSYDDAVITTSPQGSSLIEWKHFIENNLGFLLKKLSESLRTQYDETRVVYFNLLDGGDTSVVHSRLASRSMSYSDVCAIMELVEHVRSLIGPALFSEGPFIRIFIASPQNPESKDFVWVHQFYSNGSNQSPQHLNNQERKTLSWAQ